MKLRHSLGVGGRIHVARLRNPLISPRDHLIRRLGSKEVDFLRHVSDANLNEETKGL